MTNFDSYNLCISRGPFQLLPSEILFHFHDWQHLNKMNILKIYGQYTHGCYRHAFPEESSHKICRSTLVESCVCFQCASWRYRTDFHTYNQGIAIFHHQGWPSWLQWSFEIELLLQYLQEHLFSGRSLLITFNLIGLMSFVYMVIVGIDSKQNFITIATSELTRCNMSAFNMLSHISTNASVATITALPFPRPDTYHLLIYF